MTPYWTDGQVTLYLGDCREVTEWLSADVLVTDPPYGRAWKQGNVKGNRPSQKPDGHQGIQGDANTSVRDSVLALWGERPAVVFGDLMLAPPSGAKHVLIWRKPSCGAGFRGAVAGFRRDAEAVYLVGSWPTGLGGQTSVIASGTNAQSGASGVTARYGHPHAKPVDVMETLIAACPPGTIADPFCGSGSSLVAARNQGRRAVGVEVDERYAEQAARRLAQSILTA